MKRKEIKEQRAINREQRSWSKIRKSCYFLFTLCYLLFVFACSVDIPRSEKEPLPSGYGSFSLQLPANAARTILPVAPGLDKFEVFELDFKVVLNGNGEDRNVKFSKSELTGTSTPSYILVAGTYDITLNAYLGGNTTTPTNLAARGKLEDNVTIAPGDVISRQIRLHAINNEGTGTFSWNVIPLPADLTSAKMRISSGTPTVTVEVDLSDNPNSFRNDLEAGIYNVVFELVRSNQRALWYEILYVYSSLTSPFVMAFNDNFFHGTHNNVTFKYNNPNYISGGDSATVDYIQSVLHGGTIVDPPDPDFPLPVRPGYKFDGWFDNAALTGTEWNLADGYVFGDMTLYAKWIPNEIGITIVPDFSELGDKAPVIIFDDTPIFDATTGEQTNNLTLSRSGAGGIPATRTIDVTGTSGSIAWKIQGVGVNANNTDSGDTGTIIIDANHYVYGTLGWHTVDVEVTVDGSKYKRSFRFNIIL